MKMRRYEFLTLLSVMMICLLAGRYTMSAHAQATDPIDDFQIEGTIAYITQGTSWSVVDVSETTNPILLAQTYPEMPDEFEQLDSVRQSTVNVIGERLYFYVRMDGVAWENGAVWTYDVSDPAVPVLLGSDTLHGALVGLNNNTAYTIDGWDYQLYDLTDPNQIIEVQSDFNVPGEGEYDSWIEDFNVFNGVTYVQYGGETGIPSWIGTDEERSQALLELVGVILGILDFEGNFYPSPTISNSEIDTFREIFEEKGVALSDADYEIWMDNVSVTEDGILYLSINYSDLVNQNHTLTFDLNETNTLTDMVTTMELIEGVAVDTVIDDIAYAPTSYPTATMRMFDVSDRSDPIELGVLDGTMSYPSYNGGDDFLYSGEEFFYYLDEMFRVTDDALYVLGETPDGSGILRWDTTNPITPTVIPTDSIDFLSLHSVGNTVYSIVEGELTIVDVTDLTQPIHLGSYSPVATTVTTSVSSSFYLNSTTDAVEERADGTMYLDNSGLEIGRDANQLIGLRYQNVNIPPNVTITDAKLTFTVDEPQAEPASGTFFGEAIGSTQPFTDTTNNLSNRERTAISVTWDIPTWGESDVGTLVESPSLIPIIQEIVDNADWSAGNSLSIIIEGEGRRSVASYGANAPILQIEYVTAVQSDVPLTVHLQSNLITQNYTSLWHISIVGLFLIVSSGVAMRRRKVDISDIN